MKPEVTDLSNKEFVKQHIPFAELKKVGFYGNEIKRTDYDTIVNRFLTFFGTTKRQYILNLPIIDFQISPNVITGKMPSIVDKDGKLNQDSFHLSMY